VSAPRIRLAVGALCLLWLALGFANVARGLGAVGPDYWRWAFEHHSYSDLLTLYSPRYLGGAHPVPYLQDRIEYPPVLGLVLWLPSLLPGGPAAYLAVTALFLAGCLALALWSLSRLPDATPWWLAATPALAYYAFLNWDLLPVALIAASLLALDRGQPARSGALAALGTAAKLFPAALVPAAFGALGATSRPALRRWAVVAAGLLLALNLPLALVAFDGWSWFFRFNAARGAENSVWHALGGPAGGWLDLAWLGPVALTGLAALLGTWRCARRGGDAARAARLGTALVLVAWIALNKVWSPQYALYGFLAGALVAAPGWLFAALTAVSVADYHLEFEVRARDWSPGFVEALVKPSELLRTGLWLVLAAWIGAALWREARRPLSSPSAT
jgi:Glycosyltransferase family 87